MNPIPAVLQSVSAALLHLHRLMEVLQLMHQTVQESGSSTLVEQHKSRTNR